MKSIMWLYTNNVVPILFINLQKKNTFFSHSLTTSYLGHISARFITDLSVKIRHNIFCGRIFYYIVIHWNSTPMSGGPSLRLLFPSQVCHIWRWHMPGHTWSESASFLASFYFDQLWFVRMHVYYRLFSIYNIYLFPEALFNWSEISPMTQSVRLSVGLS